MPNRFERHPVRAAFLLAGFALFAFLALDVGAYYAGEGITAFRENLALRRGTALPRPPGAQRGDLEFHHGLKENWTSHNGSGATAYDEVTNSLGFRDERVRDVPLKAPGRRIILIGDSFTEGVGLPFADTFAGMLLRRLATAHTEVLNASATSYSPIIYFRKLKYLLEEKGLVADEVVVFLDLSDIQDETFYRWGPEGQVQSATSREWVRYALTTHGEPYWLNWALQRTYVSKTLFGMLQRLSLPRDLPNRKALNFPRALWTLDPHERDGFVKKGLPLALAHLDSLKALLDARAVAMKLVIYPWPDQVWRHDLPSKQESIWGQWTTAHRVPFLDLFPDFIEAGPVREVLARYFLPGDIHFSKAGHRLVADRVLAEFWPATPP